MKWWKDFLSLCWLRGHDHEQVVDCDARRAFQLCGRCGHEFQYDFQAGLSPGWVGFCDEDHSCELCMGWKPRGWDRCANEVCLLNPNGPLSLLPDGEVGYDLDGRTGHG